MDVLHLPSLIGSKSTIILFYKWRVVIYLVILCCLYIFLWCLTPSELVSEFIKTDEPHECVADRLKPFATKLRDLDAFLIQPENTQTNLLTFTGNGFIGCSFQDDHIVIHNNGFLSQKLKIPVLITLDVHGYVNFKALLLDIRDGLMHKMSCFKHVNELCVSSGTTVYAHRRYPSLLIQTFRVYNPMDWENTVKVDKGNLRNWTELVSLRFIRLQQKSELKNHASEEVTYQVACGLVKLPLPDYLKTNDPFVAQLLVVVVFEPMFPENLTVPSGSTQSYTFVTGIRVSDQPILVTEHDLIQLKSDLGIVAKERTRLESLITSELVFALSYPENELRKEHTDAWNFLWTSGITISHSYAPGAVNPKDINTTLYYLASNTPDLLLTQSSVNNSAINEYKIQYKDYNQCFRGTYTLETFSLWQPVTSISTMHNLVRSWHHTLIDGGCEKLLHTGVYGLHQAVLRSIGSFYVSYDHISFNYPHDSLYRDIVFRRIQLNKPGIYANFEIRLLSREGSISSPHLMAVELSVWRSPSLSVLLSTSLYNHLSKDMYDNKHINQAINFFIKLENDAFNDSLYVCPAACHSTPVPVKFTRLIVPFTISIPPTALMYLGSELKDLIKYSQTLHFVEVYTGPAPKHDIITMHRHGHVFGGLPWLFWISLVLLIAIFHMFFCKIIYNELRNKNQMSIPRDSWRLPRYASDLISSTAFETRGISNTQISRRRITDLDTIP